MGNEIGLSGPGASLRSGRVRVIYSPGGRGRSATPSSRLRKNPVRGVQWDGTRLIGGEEMRGTDRTQSKMFSYVSPEARIPADHPLRATREMTNQALVRLDRKFRKLYSRTGRPSIPPEQLLRALLLQVLYSIRSERMLMEQLEYNLLFRWFVGLEMDDRVWDVTVFTKNRNRLLEGEIAENSQAVPGRAREVSAPAD